MSNQDTQADENSSILRQMRENGDSLINPRMIDFCFVFPERKQALAFAEMLDDRDLKVCISYFNERAMWQAIVHRYMAPICEEITSIEQRLSGCAESVGGKADGWGCFIVTEKDIEQ